MSEHPRRFDYASLLQPLQEVEPARWQTESFGGTVPEELRLLRRFSAGRITVGGEFLDWTFLSERSLGGDAVEKYVARDTGRVIVTTLEKILQRMGKLGSTEEISFSLVNHLNPELGNVYADGYSPTAFQVNEDTREVREISSGSIILFPPALRPGPYLGILESVPHVGGIISHEWAHQFMAADITGANNLTLFKIWSKHISGWRPLPNGGYGYEGSELPPTPYAALNPVDDFAESLMLYILDPKRLQKMCPKRYNFCHDYATEFSKGAIIPG